MKLDIKTFITFLFIALISSNAMAEDIKITSDDGIEWHQNEQKIVAIKNVVAKKDGMILNSQKITALYKNSEKKNQKTAIYYVIAEEDVFMNNNTAKAYGEKLEYDIEKEIILLSGKPAKIKTESEVITAKDVIEYYPKKEIAIGRGDVTLVKGDKTISADIMKAYFTKSRLTQNLEVDRIEFFDNIKITTPNEVLTGDKGIYYAKKSIATISDNVKITQGKNSLSGDYAEINLKTGFSKLKSKKENGRVKGIFVQEKK